MRKRECIAMLLAGGQGSRLGGLTTNIAKPAVVFGGKYRTVSYTHLDVYKRQASRWVPYLGLLPSLALSSSEG